MADRPEPAVDPIDDDERPAGDPVADGAPSHGRRRSFDGRTLAIAGLLGLIAALLTALIASFVLSDDTPNDGMELKDPEKVDTAQLLDQPLETADGGTTSLGDQRDGKPMLVNLFASNCVPCVDEMPLLTAAHADNPDVTFVGVATQDDQAKAEALVEETKIDYPWALDPTGELFYEAKGKGMPTTLLLSDDGDVVDSKTGAFKSQAELQTFIDQAS